MTFKILWSIDVAVALVVGYFFVAGLADGSVSSFNMNLWLVILAVVGGILWGGRALRLAGRTRLANTLLVILAGPGVLVGLFFLALIILRPRWN